MKKMIDAFMKLNKATPAYVFDLEQLKDRVGAIKNILSQCEIIYAMKANPFLTGAMSEIVDRFEVCSPGEFRICERLSIPMEKIVLSGVYKNPEDMEYVLKTYNGKGVYTIESLTQMELLCSITKKLGLKIDVLIRVTSGNQFGLDKQDVRNIIENRKEYPWIHIQGLQFYSGTQKKMTQMQQELEELDVFIAELENEYGCKIDVLEYGPGFAVPYFMKDKDDELQDTLLQFKEAASNLQFKGKLTLEMGRYLAAYCGYFFTSVVDMKKNMEQNYAILDGGIHHLNYYGQTLAMKLPHCEHYRINGEKAEGEEELWNLCGSLCTVSDVIVKRFPLNSLKMNDILMFERTGAYSVTEGISLFLSRPLPKVYFWNEKDGLTLIRDGLHTDILNSEK